MFASPTLILSHVFFCPYKEMLPLSSCAKQVQASREREKFPSKIGKIGIRDGGSGTDAVTCTAVSTKRSLAAPLPTSKRFKPVKPHLEEHIKRVRDSLRSFLTFLRSQAAFRGADRLRHVDVFKATDPFISSASLQFLLVF